MFAIAFRYSESQNKTQTENSSQIPIHKTEYPSAQIDDYPQLEPNVSQKDIALQEFARDMSKKELSYAESWIPNSSKTTAGNSTHWLMDCSNTARYTYQEIFQRQIPRTSLDQYLFAKNQSLFYPIVWETEKELTRKILLRKLKAGDLLFWKNTTNVQANPPISHVMIYLGRDNSDKMFMFGASTSARSQATQKSGGIGIYPFDPYAKIGCVKDSFGVCTIYSEFVGWARLQLE
ncbi:MAG: C40 family peptidase [Leptospiraceae bacterium]|nr:C40 family peptidase [Leptospiraceae bacterium]